MTYKENFEARIRELLNLPLKDTPKVAERNKIVNEMIEEYYSHIGEMPNSYLLTLLGDFILADELKDRDVDKMTNTAYPFLSEHQEKRRHRRQHSMQDETIDFLNNKFNKRLHSLSRRTTQNAEY